MPLSHHAQGVDHPIPIMVGGGEKHTLKTLATYGDLMKRHREAERVEHPNGVLDGHCEAAGRDPAEIERTLHTPNRIIRDDKRAREARGDTAGR